MYEFVCPSCQHPQEEICARGTQTMPCEVCGAEAQRVPSVSQIKFVGWGFYATDYGAKHFCLREKNEELARLGKPLLDGGVATPKPKPPA
jgi:predicted nucleic acid-binding Zn ribbon protein